MNTTTKTESAALQTLQESPAAETSRSQAGSLMLDARAMDSMMRMADLMASGKSTIPAHLKNSPADCMAVCMQAAQWGMNPFAVAQKTHIVNGQLGYEAQLVNAVVQASNAIVGHFHYEFKGSGAANECRVGAIIRGDKEITWGEWLNENKVTTKNSPLWKTNPRQQLGYLQCKNWARLHTPGAILGVYTPDEMADSPIPRNMGEAQQVEVTVPADLMEQASQAAEHGVAAYQKFFKATGLDNRKLLAGHHERLKAVAAAADSSRTVDQDTGEIKGVQKVDAPAGKTFDQILTGLCAAGNLDALYTWGDWIETIADADDLKVLNAKFDEMQAQLEGGAA